MPSCTGSFAARLSTAIRLGRRFQIRIWFDIEIFLVPVDLIVPDQAGDDVDPPSCEERAQLLDQVWGDHVYIEERTVDVHIRRLRLALEPFGADRMIETVRGSGYRLAVPR